VSKLLGGIQTALLAAFTLVVLLGVYAKLRHHEETLLARRYPEYEAYRKTTLF